MLITYNWLKEFTEIDIPAEELAEKLTMLGLEVVTMHKTGIEAKNKDLIHLTKVAEIYPVKDSDKLKLCEVTVNKKKVQVVTNSPKVQKGDYVAIASPGAVLAKGLEVKAATIKGVQSEGMLIAKELLNLEEKSADIWNLGQDEKRALEEYTVYTQEDTVYEMELTANRSDCLSILGVAREAAAVLDKPLKSPKTQLEETLKEKPDITISDKNLCPRYASRLIKGITVRESPVWMRRKLELCGLRSINNIVDATNYVLIEMGHPTHAFDLDRLEGKKIIVRRAKKGEAMKVLDGTELKLDDDALVITDEKRAVALAGVMGGENSEIVGTTKNLLLESAYFDPISIRMTSKKTGVKTDASYHFERTADWGIPPAALDRICELVLMTCPGSVSAITDAYPNVIKDRIISIREDYVNSKLGIDLTIKEIEDFLRRLGFAITLRRDDSLEVKAPTFRSDIEKPIDLVEEIARIYGYNTIPEPYFNPPIDLDGLAQPISIKNALRPILSGIGYTEVYNLSFTSPEELEKYRSKDDTLISLNNPLSADASVLRNYLYLGMVKNVEFNVTNASKNALRFYEFGHVFKMEQDSSSEVEKLGFALYGEKESYSTLLGTVEYLAQKMGTKDLDFKKTNLPFLHPVNSSVVQIGDKRLGFVGELHPDIVDAIDLRYPVYLAEFNLSVLESIYEQTNKIVPIIKFPPALRDLSVVIENGVMARTVLNFIREYNALIRDVRFIDMYQGANIGEGKKSVTFSLTIQSGDKTMSEAEISEVMNGLTESLKKKFKAELRS